MQSPYMCTMESLQVGMVEFPFNAKSCKVPDIPRLPPPRRERISFCKEPDTASYATKSQAVPGCCSSLPSGVASRVEIKPGTRNIFCLSCCLSSSPVTLSVFQLVNKESWNGLGLEVTLKHI